jgi:phosphatidylglycerophosphate synthase
MLDAAIRRLIDPPLARLAARIGPHAPGADAVTILGFALGLAAAAAIARHFYLAGLVLFALNRLCDRFDGALARATKVTDLGAFLDIALDFIVYAAIPFAFALADPSRALAASFLIFSFMATSATFLSFAIFAAKRGLNTDLRGQKSLYYLGGLTEGSETFLAFAIACVRPDWFSIVAYVFGALCFVTAGTRVAAAVQHFGES